MTFAVWDIVTCGEHINVKRKDLIGDCTVEYTVFIIGKWFKTVISDLVAEPGPVLLL